MNAISMIKGDHKKVQELFRSFERIGERSTGKKQYIAERTFAELDIHAQLEEELFYPEVRMATEEGADLVAEATKEHDQVKQLIAELQGMPVDAVEFEPKFKLLTENVRHHIREEESEMLPHARNALGEKTLARIGREMATRKRQLNADGLLEGALRRAKKLVTKAFDALAGTAASDEEPALKRPHRTLKIARKAKRLKLARRMKSAKKRTTPRAKAVVRKAARRTARPTTNRKRIKRAGR